MAPFADYLSLTTPAECSDSVIGDVMPVLDAAGGGVEFGDEFSSTVRIGLTGTVKLSRRFGVLIVSASGDALGALRKAGLFGEYLAALSPHPHRITRLDATLDVVADAPVLIRSLWRTASAGRIALVPPHLRRDVRRRRSSGASRVGSVLAADPCALSVAIGSPSHPRVRPRGDVPAP